jgi:hypothetical protein
MNYYADVAAGDLVDGSQAGNYFLLPATVEVAKDVAAVENASPDGRGRGGELEGSDHRLSPTVPSEPPEQARSLFRVTGAR